MAVKIIRQQKKIALLGSVTSAAALRAGHEHAPRALRAAGLVERLKAAGFEIADLGDTATYVFQQDDEHPRARNVATVLKSLNDLRPRVEVAVKSGALPLILSGDCISVLAIIAGTRRYYRNVSLIYIDRDADLSAPATTTSGSVDGMVISQVIGRGAPELVRFWGEPPLVREPDIALFGFERINPQEEQYLLASPLRRHPALEVATVGSAVTAHAALERVHVAKNEFVLHIDLDTISAEDFPWTDTPGNGGLTLDDVRAALRVFAAQPNLAALQVAGYNPELDPDGQGAGKLIDLLVEALATRLETGSGEMTAGTDAAAPVSAPLSDDALRIKVPQTDTLRSKVEPEPHPEPESVSETVEESTSPVDPDSITS